MQPTNMANKDLTSTENLIALAVDAPCGSGAGADAGADACDSSDALENVLPLH